jgi:type I restriction enzyme S subunit
MAPALIPLPPHAEQHRIVAKVDELMALCDRLEASRREQDTRREQLTVSAHHHLNNGGNAEELRTHSQFFIGNLPRLTKRPYQIKQLRQTILHLGLSGKLVSQNRKDTPASNLLATIAKKRAVLLQAGYPNDNEARTQSKKREALGSVDVHRVRSTAAAR